MSSGLGVQVRKEGGLHQDNGSGMEKGNGPQSWLESRVTEERGWEEKLIGFEG